MQVSRAIKMVIFHLITSCSVPVKYKYNWSLFIDFLSCKPAEYTQQVLLFEDFAFWNKIACSPGQPQAHRVADNDLETKSPCLSLLGARIRGTSPLELFKIIFQIFYLDILSENSANSYLLKHTVKKRDKPTTWREGTISLSFMF